VGTKALRTGMRCPGTANNALPDATQYPDMAPSVTCCAGDRERAAKHLLLWTSDTLGFNTHALRTGMRNAMAG
jgi:hypothetical protein